MKKVALLLLALAVANCGKEKPSGNPAIDEPGKEESFFGFSDDSAAETPKEEESDGEIIPHELRDNKNQLMAYVPLPSNWIMHKSGKASMSGPGEVFVYDVPIRNFVMTNDQYMAQSYQSGGGKLRQFASAEEIIKQDFLPLARQQGSKLIRITPLPEVARADQAPLGMMYTIGQHNNRYDAALSEWEDQDGRPYAIVVHVNGSSIMNSVMWSYRANILDAPKERFESAKRVLVGALSGITYNPRYFDQYNANEQQREATSWAAFNQRMQANWQSFNAQQAAFKAKSEAVNQSIMSGYESRMAAMDRNHNRFVNYIKGEETVRSADGSRHQVQGGSNQYYMNGNNQYIGTNDPNYDPNRDPGVNGQQWDQVEVVD